MKYSTKRYFSVLGLITSLVCIRAGEYLVDYIIGDKNGKVTTPLLSYGLFIVYGLLIILLTRRATKSLYLKRKRVFKRFSASSGCSWNIPQDIEPFVKKYTYNPLLWVFFLACCSHIVILYTYPPVMGPDWALYPGSAIELFQNPLRNPYILIDRNGYYPYLIWLFLQLPGGIISLVYFQHIVCIGFTLWTVRVIETFFGKWGALLSGIVLSLYLPLIVAFHITNSEAANLLVLWPTVLFALTLSVHQFQGKRINRWLLIGLGVSSGLSFLARPSNTVLLFTLFVALWFSKALPKHFVIIVISMGVCILPVFLYNYFRLNYLGIEKKSGRILFQVAWMADKSYSPDNGPASLRVAELLRKEWDSLLKTNPVVKKNNESINDILAQPDELPYDLYYLVITLVRKEYPPKQADRLLKDAAIEAISKNFKQFVRKRIQKFHQSIFVPPRFQLGFPESSKDVLQAYASDPTYRYRRVATLYHYRGYLQTQTQVEAFLTDFRKLMEQVSDRKPSPVGLRLVKQWWRLIAPLRYIELYGMVGLFFLFLWKLSGYLFIPEFKWNSMLLFGGIGIFCIVNRIFVYGISFGTTLHLLPSLAFELIMGGLGVLGVIKFFFSE